MREVFTDKNFQLTKIARVLKIFLIVAFLTFFLPLFILPFFNHAFGDDYYYGDKFYKLGFWDYQQYIYNNWSGRFTSTFLSTFFLSNKYLYNHYYLHTLLFLALNLLMSYLLFQAAGRCFLKRKISRWKTLFVCLTFNAVTVVCAPDVGGLLFWFSSSIVYYAGLVFFQLELLLCLLSYHTVSSFRKTLSLIAIPFIVFVVNGFSEVFIVMQLSVLCLLYLTGFFKKAGVVFFPIFLLAFVGSALLSLTSPGNHMRSAAIPFSNDQATILAFVFGLIKTGWAIFKNPLTWFFFALSILCGYYTWSSAPKAFSNKGVYYILMLFCFLLIFPVLSIAEGIVGLKGKIVPGRFLNIVCFFTLLVLFSLAFFFGARIKIKSILFILNKSWFNVMLYVVLIICLCCNEYTGLAYKSILAAPVYNMIIKERENIFKKAANKNEIAVVRSYDFAFQQYMHENHPRGSTTYYKWARQKPVFISNDVDDNDEQAILVLKNFYKIDSVFIEK